MKLMQLIDKLSNESIKEDYADSESPIERESAELLEDAIEALENYITVSSSTITDANAGLSNDAYRLISIEFDRIKKRYADDHYLPVMSKEDSSNSYTLTLEMLSNLHNLKEYLEEKKKCL